MSIDWDKPVQGRDGSEARVYTTTGQNPVYPVIGEFIDDDGVWLAHSWTYGGLVFTGKTNAGDLVNVPQKHTGWENRYASQTLHNTKEAADRMRNLGRIACIEVAFTEGEGLAETDTSE